MPTLSPLPLSAPNAVARALREAGSVFAEEEAALIIEAADGDPAQLSRLLEQRCKGKPLEQLLGWAEFAGLRIEVHEGVFVPRRRTELLARHALEACTSEAIVVDLCCGSGAIAASILSAMRHVQIYATDHAQASVDCARRNLGSRATVLQGDLFTALPDSLRGKVDVLAVNAPYVPSDSIAFMPPEARLYEPRNALDGGHDGLDFHRRVAADAVSWLHPESTVVIETSTAQATQSAALFTASGFHTRIVHDQGIDGTVVVATRSSP